MSNTLLTVSGVTKSFKDVTALQHVDLQFDSGEDVGLVGGNGAGKTTLLRLLCGLYRPTSGDVRGMVEGDSVDIHKMREHVGVVPESTGVYARLTAWENIRYHSRLSGVDDEMAWTRTERFAKLLNFDQDLHRSTRGFSRGMRHNTALLRALSHGPKILLLDEPTSSMDQTTEKLVIDNLNTYFSDQTVILVTHRMSLLKMVDRVIALDDGKVTVDGKKDDIVAKLKGIT